MTPIIGRIVHYYIPMCLFEGGYDSKYGQSLVIAAIITEVFTDDVVNLTIFPDGSAAPFHITGIPCRHTANEKTGHFWNWPPRA